MNNRTRQDLIDFVEAVQKAMPWLYVQVSSAYLSEVEESSKRLKESLRKDETILDV